MHEGTQTALHRLFPRLESRAPCVGLCTLPTPVRRLEALEREAGTGPLWVKCDELSAPEYGGNKVRKLEWIFGEARRRGIRRAMTFGALGTHHGFATALYAARLGMVCELVLAHQPVTEEVRRQLLLDHAVGARLFYGRGVPGVIAIALARLLRHPRTAIVPVGGSSPVGTLGFVNAGLELASQIESGDLPHPARIYVGCGSGGSAAGLALGLALAGSDARVIAVNATDILARDLTALRRLARRSYGLLRRAGAPDALPELALELEAGFRGPGYGVATPEAERALGLAAELEQLRLDSTYTAKALAALLERERGSHDPVLFWNTFAADEPELSLPHPGALPPAFQRFFQA